MTGELTDWLNDHQMILLPQWASALMVANPANGHAAEPPAGTVAVDEPDTLTSYLEELYTGLLLAARGDLAALEERVRAMGESGSSWRLELPRLLAMITQFRRLAWHIVRHEETDPARSFDLMDELEAVLEQTTQILSQYWMQAAEREIEQRGEEADFIAQSMNEAIEQADHTAVQLSMLNEVSRQLASSLESAETLEIIAYVGSKLMDMSQVAHIAIWLLDDSASNTSSDVTLCAMKFWGQTPEFASDILYSPTPQEPAPRDVIVQAYVQSTAIKACDPAPDPKTQGNWYIPGCGVLALPLLVKDHAIGVVVLQDFNPAEKFAADKQDLWRSVINQAAIALDNRRLYKQVRRFNSDLEQLVEQRTRELQAEKDRLSTLHDIATEVSSTLDLDSLLHRSLEALANITNVAYGSIMMIDYETEHLVNKAMLGQKSADSFTRFPIGTGVAGWVAHHKKPALIGDITQDERWVSLPTDPTEEVEHRKKGGSMLSVPLIVHDECLGVLTLSHEQPNYFNEDHLRLLTASAGAVAIGIHNANLFTITMEDMERHSKLLRQQQTETIKNEAILQSLSDGVLVCDPDGAVLSVNPAGVAILERSIEEVLLSDLYHVLEWLPDNQIDKLLLNELLKRPADADGNARRFESTVQIGLKTVNLTLKSVFKDSGGMSDTEFIGALLVLRDKTREVESDRLKTEFIGTMSHELRTPMTSIKGYTQLLVMGSLGPVNDTQREFLDTIQTNAERMISIINEVLELTKIETGSIDLEKRAVHLPEVLGSVFAELRSLAAAREHELLPGSHLTSMPSVQADPTRLHQVLVNLVSNGIKYTPKGGSIVVDGYEAVLEELPQHVRDCLSADRRYTQIDVCDTGVGIAAHELDKVFERFYRTENPMKVEAGGTGLGLSLTRPLIELMGGRIWVTSTLGEGSTFSFILPTE